MTTTTTNKTSNRLSLPTMITKTLPLPSVHRDENTIPRASELIHSAKNELGAWWTSGKRATDPSYHRPRAVSNPSTAPSSTTATSADYDFIPASRAHLHYRDETFRNAQPYPQTNHSDQSRYFTETVGVESYGKEEESMRAAIDASRNQEISQEEKDLRQALAASNELARSLPTRSDSVEFENALAESRAFAERQRKPSPPPLPFRPNQSTLTSTSTSSNSLEASEWRLRARAEKGRLWGEGGAHGLLPPGAGRAVGEDEEERRMLELAIRISLEEEEVRIRNEEGEDDMINQVTPAPILGLESTSNLTATPSPPKRPLPPIPSVDDTSTSTDVSPPPKSPTSQSTPKSNKIPLAFIAPSRPKIFSYISQNGSPEEKPYLESFTTAKETQTETDRSVSNSHQELGRRSTFGASSGEGADGEERPSTLGSGSAQSESEGRESFDSAISQKREETLPNLSTPSRSLSIRNPDEIHAIQQLDGEEAKEVVAEEGKFSPNLRDSNRSMSFISERTEPPNEDSSNSIYEETSERNQVDSLLPTPSTSSFKRGSQIEMINVGASPNLLAKMEQERLAGVYGQSKLSSESSRNGSNEILERESQAQSVNNPLPLLQAPLPATLPSSLIAESLTPPETTEDSPPLVSPSQDQRIIFGDGIRFGFGAPCSIEEDHACATDGLRSEGPFPENITLSTRGIGDIDTLTLGERGEVDPLSLKVFSVEANTFTSLLRFLMWYGDTTIRASEVDVEKSESRHCESSLTLQFRRNDEGLQVLRLNITLLPSHHSFSDNTLHITTSSSVNGVFGKGKSKARIPLPVFELPDHLVLPVRLNQIAISLYTLRQLSNIASSTLPSKDASHSYHSLRTLSLSITDLAREHENKGNKSLDAKGKKDEDRLVSRLKDRLRRIGGGGGGGSGGNNHKNGSKLIKAPPIASRTRNLGRNERVLSSDDGTEIGVGHDGVLVQVEQESVESVGDSDGNTSREMRYVPELLK